TLQRLGVALLVVAGLSSVVLLGMALARSGVQLSANGYGSAYLTLGAYAIALALTGVARHLGAHIHGRVQRPSGAAPPLPKQIAELFWAFVVIAGLIVYATICASPHLL